MSDTTPALYVGLDVSLAETHICVLDQSGSRVFEGVVASDPDALEKLLNERAPACSSIAIETGATTPWLWRELRKRGVAVTCIDARHANRALSMRRNETDRNDAQGLAELMRIGWYKEAYVRTVDAQHIRSMMNGRYQLRQCRKDILNQMQGIVKVFGLFSGSTATTKFPEMLRQVAADNPMAARMLTPLLNAFHALETEIDAYEVELRDIAKHDSDARRLMTIPGVGYLVALRYMSAIEDPARFTSSAKVGAYLGLTPRVRQSGEGQWTAGIGPAPDPILRSYLYEAAGTIITRIVKWSRLKAWGVRLYKRVGFKRAAIAVARKLATIMHAVWSDGTEFVYSNEPTRAQMT
ncbi:IS110 family transposase [Loktanella sp. DJP18]|uniref:IS110 family transposase n=1 Tax=Loktanella sp. DJP18 TaxID=3409788 RepID=UPI003BB7A2CD